MTRNIALLFIAQIFGMSGSIIITFLGSIIGIHLSPYSALVSLPISVLVLGAAVFSIPSALLMKKFGRKHCFLLASLLATLGAGLGGFALELKSFLLFCIASFLIGINTAFVQQYRFAVVEELDSTMATRSISILLFGNLISVFAGIQLAIFFKNLMTIDYVGSFIVLTLFLFIASATLCFYKNINLFPAVNKPYISEQNVITKNLVPAIVLATCSYVVMSLIMIATPVNIHAAHQLPITNISTIMLFHLLAMYCPSLIISRLTRIINSTGVIVIGLVSLLLATIVNLTGINFLHYCIGLILVGVGWNFSFISATTIFTESYFYQDRFKFQAINDFCLFGFNALASLLSGGLVLRVGWNVLNLLSLVIIMVMIFSIIYIYKNNRDTVAKII